MNTTRPATIPPSRQLEGFLAKFDPVIARIAREARAKLRKRFPTAVQLVYDNYNALAIGFCTTERTSTCMVSVAVYARGVSLYFYYGASLPDPDGILRGSGNQGRFVRLDSVKRLDDPGVRRLLTAAERDADPPPAKTGRGALVIRLVSAKQRPRRLK